MNERSLNIDDDNDAGSTAGLLTSIAVAAEDVTSLLESLEAAPKTLPPKLKPNDATCGEPKTDTGLPPNIVPPVSAPAGDDVAPGSENLKVAGATETDDAGLMVVVAAVAMPPNFNMPAKTRKIDVCMYTYRKSRLWLHSDASRAPLLTTTLHVVALCKSQPNITGTDKMGCFALHEYHNCFGTLLTVVQ